MATTLLPGAVRTEDAFGLEFGNEDTSTEALNWRLEQHRVFSDWTIVVTTRAPREFAPYGGDVVTGDTVAQYVGRQLSRTFAGYDQAFDGTVQGWRDDREEGTLFKVLYSDGDEEELTMDELEQSLKSRHRQARNDVTGPSTRTYYCHRIVLGVGTRACSYFARLFSPTAQAFLEGENSQSELELEESSAAAFPLLLDFLYTGELKATVESSVALLDLAQYLGCRPAFDAAIGFINANLCSLTSALYIREASAYPFAAPLLKEAVNFCADHISEVIHSDNSVLNEIPPELFVQVVQAASLQLSETAELSVAVADYLEYNESSVNGQLLVDLCNGSTLPSVAPEAALRLLRLDCRFKSPHGDESKHARTKSAPVAKKPKKTSSLRERCIRAIGDDFRAIAERSLNSEKASFITGLPSEVAVELLETGVQACFNQLDELDNENHSLKVALEDEIAAHNKTVQDYNDDAIFRDNME